MKSSKHKRSFFGDKNTALSGGGRGEGANHVYLLGRTTITFWRRLFCFGKSEEWGCFVWLVGVSFAWEELILGACGEQGPRNRLLWEVNRKGSEMDKAGCFEAL